MAETMRSLFANDSSIARALDGDDDDHDNTRRNGNDSGASDLDDNDNDQEKAEAASLQDSIESSSTTATGSTYTYPASAARARGPRGAAGQGDAASHNTGPKGVRADASAFQHAANQAHSQKQLLYNASLEKRAMTTTTWSEDQQEADLRERWVEMRLKELSKQKGQAADTSDEAAGFMRHVDADGFLSTVERERRVCVVVTDGSASSETQEMLAIMRALAKRHHKHALHLQRTHTQPVTFIHLEAHEAELDEVAVPAVLGYVNGQLEANLMRVADEIESGTRVSEASMEKVLIKYGIIGVQATKEYIPSDNDHDDD